MLRNHFKFAIRIFLKDGAYSILNILGLTLGISVGIILLLYLQNELNYDTQHNQKDQIYRMTHHLKAGVVDFNTARTARELAPFLKAEIPEVLDYVRFTQYNNEMVTVDAQSSNPKQFYEEFISQTDSTILSIFSHEVLEGNRNTCLSGPDKIVLTKSIAEKYYGDESALGKIIVMSNGDKRTVSAVISDLPDNAHFKYEILVSQISERDWVTEAQDKMRKSEAMWNADAYTYLLMPKGYNPKDFDAKFELVFEKYFRPFADRISGTAEPLLQPLTSIHFESKLSDDEPVGNMQFVYAFMTVGFFIMLLACINYMNLATARSVIRTREIGVRKVLGNTKSNLFAAILLEAFILAAFAMLLSIQVSYLVLEFSPLNAWIGKDLALNFMENTTLLFGTIGITVLIALLSGIYPALYIPSMQVVSALKGAASSQSSGVVLRKALIVTQFVVSIFVVISTVLMGSQIDYLKKVNLGFDKENVVMVEIRDESMIEKMEAIKGEILNYPNVTSVATSWHNPGKRIGGQVFKVEQNGEMIDQDFNVITCGGDYLKTMGMELLEGRDFIANSEADAQNSFIINEAAVKMLGWDKAPINKRIKFFHAEADGHVIGVVKDFNYESLHSKIEPMVIKLSRYAGGTINVRVNGNNLENTLSSLESTITKFDPNHPFEYQFLDQEFDKQYKADQIQHQLISVLSYICIFVSILGLIGLSAFTAGQKAKEISIRKTLGASIGSILLLFSKGYVKLILIAIVIAIPFADYIINSWLGGFAYQMSFAWYYYLLPGLAVLVFGLVTVMIQSLKSARANPVDGLRSE